MTTRHIEVLGDRRESEEGEEERVREVGREERKIAGRRERGRRRREKESWEEINR